MTDNNTDIPKQDDNNINRPRGRKPFFSWTYLLIITGLFFIIFLPSLTNQAKEITWQEFEQNIYGPGDIAKIDVVNNETVDIYITAESLKKDKFKNLPAKTLFNSPYTGPYYYFRIGSVESFEKNMDKLQANVPEAQHIAITYIKRDNWFGTILSWVLPMVIIIIVWRYLFRSLGRSGAAGGASLFNFGKSRAVLIDKGAKSKTTFKDVAGYDEAKVEVMEVVEFLKNPANYTKLGAKIPSGVLLIGPPGTGKTLMAKAVAGEADVPFFSLSGSEFIEMFVGVGASRVRDLFEKAKAKAPSIIFIDEIDTIGRRRGRAISVQVDDERESTLNQLLAEMDGFDESTGVIVLAATNRADLLDPALVRPGRFDRHIYLELPNKKERE